eukprot:TRINITY_DN17394_c0_g1_i2.p1 TRINITY_DN17394_c0_g1~~TRINITY_DN17394_c0_g1_i2.p1  ORF type:complete len:357 (+),score=44.07 TRINITY_DN17394_c0_g1_i2:93-1163(+)
MDKTEAAALLEKSLPRFPAAGLPNLASSAITGVKAKSVATLWAGMGAVYEVTAENTAGPPVTIVAKRIQLPEKCKSIGDQRKKDSYDVEGAFYSKGHAEALVKAGAIVPLPLHVDKSRGAGLTVCMSRLMGSGRGKPETFIAWLARLHATYWGARSDAACPEDRSGLAPQGCYWHLDTRPEEHARMSSSGWMGRLKMAARAIDLRLKADPWQTVCHGDAKGANILYAPSEAGNEVALVYDFQYCGKAASSKDLAYFLNVDVYPSEQDEDKLLRFYHAELSALLKARGEEAPPWESLKTSFELALCDWRRFTEIGLGGWGDESANHRVKKLLDRLDGGKILDSEEAYIAAMQREFPV